MAQTRRTKRTGLGTTGLDRGSARSVIAQMRDQQPTEEIQQLDLELIAHDPDNPASRQDPDPEMVASITAVGVLQPIVVVPVQTWLENRPDHTDALAETPTAQYVAWLGNRRTTNSRAAGKTSIPGVIRTDVAALAQDTGKVHENTIRRGLTPSEEAQSLRNALDRHSLTQRTLAEHLGTSEPRVSKLLRLLDLPAPVRALVDARVVAIEAAIALLREDEQVQERVAEIAEGDTEESIDLARMIVAAKQQLAQERHPTPDPTDVPHPISALPRQEPDEDEAGDTAAAETAPRTSTPDDTPAKPARQPSGGEDTPEPEPAPTSEAQPASESDQATIAGRRREESLHHITQRPASTSAMTDAVAASWLTGQAWGSTHRALAKSLLTSAGFEAQADVIGTRAWREAVTSLSTRKALHAGWILAVAVQEMSTRAAGESWGAQEREYLRWLSSAGYTATDWEQQLLEEDTTDA